MPSVTSEELEAALVNYSLALTSRSKVSVRTSKDLVELDSWYRNDLKTIIADRRNEKGKAKEAEGSTYLTREDLGRLMEWKLAVGLFIFVVFFYRCYFFIDLIFICLYFREESGDLDYLTLHWVIQMN